MVTIDDIKRTYPLHWLVWNNEQAQLDERLKTAECDIEQLDNRGRTPLMLAVTLGYVECASVLLEHEANVNAENKQGWSDDGATMMEVDHETKKVFVEQMKLIGNENVQIMEPTEEDIVNRLTNPIVTTYIDMDKISFERAIRESLEMYQETVGKSKKDCDADDDDEDAEELSEQELREYTVRSEQWLRQLNGNDENAAQLVQGCTAREQQRIAHELSLRQYREEEQRRQLEEETFRRVLELSLTDK
ncbi:unnamed protein product [Trichogramma brassicae]|uniref:Uncharacterized protein n=1 Tax=Trichogramma brassicae TaxID=86971 RepID=A0A6H5I6G4_9HYME|nr:unnamed protein product [Trichogramma brassicae]